MKTTGSRASAVSQTRGFGDLLYDKAGARPSLDLDFAGTSSLRDKITGEYLVDHTRASNATYIDNNGLVKSAATNLIINSQLTTTSNWVKGGSSIFTPNFAEAPDGTQTAHRLQHAPTSGTFLGQTISGLTSGKTYVFSFWWKRNGTDTTAMIYYGGASHNVTIPAEWTRESFSFTVNSTTSFVQFDNIGASTNDYLIWHPQFEEGTTPTDYIETVTTINSAPRFTHERVETGNHIASSNIHTFNASNQSDLRFTNQFGSSGAHATVEPYAALSPSGKFDAHKITFLTERSNGDGNVQFAFTNPAVFKKKVFSFYAKTISGTATIRIKMGANTTTGSTNFTVTDQWQRFERSLPAYSTANTFFGICNPLASQIGTSILVYGFQLEEEQDSATTYAPSIDTWTSRLSSATYIDSTGLVKTSVYNWWENHKTLGTGSDGTESLENPEGVVEDITFFNDQGSNNRLHRSSGGIYRNNSFFRKFTGSVYMRTDQGTATVKLQVMGNDFTMCTVTDQWQRFHHVQIGNAGGQSYSFVDLRSFVNDPTHGTTFGNGGSTKIYIWGGQMEEGNILNDLTKTTGTANAAARYSHDYETLTPTGLYLEPAATNLRTYSEDLTNSNAWNNSGSGGSLTRTQDLNIVNPTGGTGATKIEISRPDITKWRAVRSEPMSIPGSDPNTASAWIKAATPSDVGKLVSIWQYDSGFRFKANVALTDKWVRFSFTTDQATGYTAQPLNIGLLEQNHSNSETSVNFYVWGAQIETGSYATSYIRTLGSQVTRAADVYTSTPNLTETFEPRGLLIEEARTNVATFTNIVGKYADWSKTAITVQSPSSPTYTTPMGTTSDLREMVENTQNSNHYQYHDSINLGTAAKCVTVFVRPLRTDRNIQLRVVAIGGNAAWVNFDLNAGIVANHNGLSGTSTGNIAWSMGTPFIEKHANGWYRIGFTNLAVASNTWTFGIYIVRKNTSTEGDSFTGDGQVGFSCWGLQYENGAFPTSYVHNETGSSVTRSADVASISGDNFGTYRTNLLSNSNFAGGRTHGSNNAAGSQSYGQNCTIINNYALSPISNKFDASKIIPDPNTSVQRLVWQNFNNLGYGQHTLANPHTISFYAKGDGCNFVHVRSGGHGLCFNLSNGTTSTGYRDGAIALSAPTAAGTVMEDLGGGWYRCALRIPATNNGSLYISVSNSATTTNIGGVTTNIGTLMYGFQIEDVDKLTNYIPSTNTFTSRLGSATYVDSNGLIKHSVVNLFPRSQPTSSTQWDNVGYNVGFTGNYATAPDGTQTAGRLTMPNAGFTYFRKTIPVVAGKTYTFSVYLKSNHATLNNTSPQVAITGIQPSSVEVVTLTDEWVRYVRTFTATTTENALIGIDNGSTAIDHLVWGFQLEESDTVGEYVNTQTTNAASGAARYSHDPNTLIPTGLFLEPAATNVLPYHNQVNQLIGVTQTANAATAPDGTQTATRIAEQAVTNRHIAYQNMGTGIPSNSTVSVFIKGETVRYVGFILHVGGGNTTPFIIDTQEGIVTQTIAGFPTYKLTKYPNGWYRFSYYHTGVNNGNLVFSACETPTTSGIPVIAGSPSYLGSTSNTFLYWGLQAEAGATLSSPILSSGSATTRAADTYTSTATTVFDRDGGNKEAIIGINGVASGYNRHVTLHRGNEIMFAVKHTTNANALSWFYGYDSRILVTVKRDTTGHHSAHAATIGPNLLTKSAFNVNETAINHSVNGGSIATTTYTSNPSTFDLTNGVQLFMNSTGNTNKFQGTIDRMTLWNKVIPNQSLINITT